MGTIDKDSQYRTRILNAAKLIKDHPIHKGVDMQAHHLISAKGAKDSGLKEDLEHLGYDINVLKNLSLIPCTLPGACQLGVQLHRGNHSYEDDEHPRGYHKKVADRIKALAPKIDDKCKKNKPIQGLLNMESLKLMKLINDFRLPLTKIYLSFKANGTLEHIGCANATSVGKHNVNKPCSKNRNHFEDVPHLNYELRIGR